MDSDGFNSQKNRASKLPSIYLRTKGSEQLSDPVPKKYLFPFCDPISLVHCLFSKIPQKFCIVPSEISD